MLYTKELNKNESAELERYAREEAWEKWMHNDNMCTK